MVTEQQSTDPNAKDVEPIKGELEHAYRFKPSDKIADRYQVIAALGSGGFAEVYHCQDLKLRRAVAVKILTEERVSLTDEAQAAARLEHPYIVQVYDISALSDGTPLVVFRYIKGQTLELCLNQSQYRRLTLNDATLQIVHQVAEALDYAHRHSVIHRDVKPSNIILDNQGDAHLTDFGLAEVKSPPQGESMLSTDVQRRLSGTIPYMAPEQLKEGKLGDEHSDLYSLAVVTYEMLTGQLPFRGRDTSLIVQIATGEPTPPTVANPELPRGIEPVLLRALNKDPNKRYPSCVAFARELEDAARYYVTAISQYEEARKLFVAKQWRQALEAYETLESKSPGFKDVAYYLEQVRHQVRLLELYEQGHKALEAGKYQETLNTLNILSQLAPDHDVADLRQQALAGLAQEEKRTLDEQYQQAVQQYQRGKYQACLDTWAVIRTREPKYPDREGIELLARKQVELREIYDQGVDQMSHERWEQAVEMFQKLQAASPDYGDVETRLAMAGYMGRMSRLLREAGTLLEQGKYAACVDKLDELRRIDASYKQDQVTALRQAALERLHERAKGLLQDGKYEESLAALSELQQHSPDYAGLAELRKLAQEGIHHRELQAKLDSLYGQAVERLGQDAYQEALELWEVIQRQEEDLDFSDPKDVEARAKSGLCRDLYEQAVEELAQGRPQQALDLWNKIRTVKDSYPDRRQVVERAQVMLQEMEVHTKGEQERKQRVQALYNQALDALSRNNPQQALERWHQVRELDSAYPDDRQVEQKSQVMLKEIAEQDKRTRARSLYSQALNALDNREPQQSLDLLRQAHELVPDFPDDQQVEQKAQVLKQKIDAQDKDKQARRAQAQSLYGQAVSALDKGKPEQALTFLSQARTVVPDLTDGQQVEQKAKTLQEKRSKERERLQKTVLRYAPTAGLVLAALLVLVFIATMIAPPIIRGLTAPRPTATPSPVPTMPKSPTPTTPAPATATARPVPSMTPTKLTPTATLTTPVVSNLATARLSASIFDDNSSEVAIVNPNEQVTVLGRSGTAWLYIKNGMNVEGFVAASYFIWSGSMQSLPDRPFVYRPSTPPTPASGGPPYWPLTIDLWQVGPGDGQCPASGPRLAFVYMAGLGGNRVYTFYWEGVRIQNCDPANSWECNFTVPSPGGPVFGTGRVVSGDGQQAERTISVAPVVNCAH